MSNFNKYLVRTMKLLCMVVMTVLVELTIQFFLQKPSSSYWKHYELKEYSDSITTVFIGPSRTFNSVDPDIHCR